MWNRDKPRLGGISAANFVACEAEVAGNTLIFDVAAAAINAPLFAWAIAGGDGAGIWCGRRAKAQFHYCLSKA